MSIDVRFPGSLFKSREAEPEIEPEVYSRKFGVAVLCEELDITTRQLLGGDKLWSDEKDGLRVRLQQLQDRVNGIVLNKNTYERMSFCMVNDESRQHIQCEVMNDDLGNLVFELDVDTETELETLEVHKPGSYENRQESDQQQGVTYVDQISKVLMVFLAERVA